MARAGAGKGRDGAEGKRRAILRAAARVFAEKGYHKSRIADVAREASVAYGLVYHYFASKEALLEAIFEESWHLFSSGIEALVDQPAPFREKVEAIVRTALEAYRVHPHAVRVMVLEVARSPFFLQDGRLEIFEGTFSAVTRLCRQAQAAGEVRRDVDPSHLAYVLLGALEMFVTGFVLGTVDAGSEAAVDAATRSTVEILCEGVLCHAAR